MDSHEWPSGRPFLSRAEFEIEFARLMLMLTDRRGSGAGTSTVEWLQVQTVRLLERAPPDLRPHVEMRIDALATAWSAQQARDA